MTGKEIAGAIARDGGGAGVCQAAPKRAVRFHPLPPEGNQDLAVVLGIAVRGAVRDFIHAHGHDLTREFQGMMVGSISKRAVNQLVSPQGEVLIRNALGRKP